VEYDFEDPQIIGQELGRIPGMAGGSGTSRVQGTALITKLLLTCPGANHDSDPNTGQQSAIGTANQGYWGDYLYNYQMGVLKWDGSQNYWCYYIPKITQVPGNVIIEMESMKPNYNAPSTYKCYFTNWPDLFTSANPKAASTSTLALNRIGTPHAKRKKMNVLFADGHIASVDPTRDFFASTSDQTTVKEYLWDAAIQAGSSVTSPPTLESTPQYKNGGWRPGVPPGF
jgi:prepilin-type processing-associated H-X9-DG protein